MPMIHDRFDERSDRRNQPSAGIQEAYNTKYGVIPTTIVKEIRPPLSNSEDESKSLANLDK
jgi:excinuclease UvrABC helicase subunit UvrB